MAKSHSFGPNTSTRGGVNGTMSPAFNKPGMGSQGTMAGPFNAPRSGGDNGLPTKIYDSLGGPKAGPMPGSVGPSQQGQKRSGTKEYPYGGGGMRDGKSNGRP